LVIVLLGGFTSNFIWCAILNFKNRTGYQYFNGRLRQASPKQASETNMVTAADPPDKDAGGHPHKAGRDAPERVPMLSNYFFSALAGLTWYMQFFFYTMGETQMGQYKFSSWTIHMASIIIFSSLWGIALKEWKASSGFTKTLLFMGLATLILSTIIVGYGNYLATIPAGR
jgi:L-rhamnose-H+ transport protein